uniref:Uncharacterized protein n=1 Tax=viral metagenome TaxID=1070528 RepID=A0A6H1ZNR4_9ZZZZ
MGVFIPVALLVAAYIGTACAVIAAVTAMTMVLIIAAVIAVASTAAATYFYIQGDIKNSMLFSGIALAAGIGGIYVTYLSESATASALMAEATADFIIEAQAAETTFLMKLCTYAQTVYAGWTAFAEAIQLKLLFQIHQIAYVVSDDYREMMTRVFTQISKVSESMGFGSLGLALLFQNVRSVVLDVSTSMGTSYDIAEIKWLSTYNEILKDISKRAAIYTKSPNALLWEIALTTEKPGYDAKGATVRSMLQGIESALTLIKTTVEGAEKIRKDLTKLVADLPAVIRDQFMPEIRKLNTYVDDFIKLNYDPTMKAAELAFDKVGNDLKKNRDDVSKISGRLKRPGRYIQEIDTLPPNEKIEDETALSTIVERGMIRDVMDLENSLKEKAPEIYKEEG